ncbi:hypothetical protein ACA910_001854 [Epithemia clementina (nom. ined.)]
MVAAPSANNRSNGQEQINLSAARTKQQRQSIDFKALLSKTTMQVESKNMIRKEDSSPKITGQILEEQLSQMDGSGFMVDVELGGKEEEADATSTTSSAQTEESNINTKNQNKSPPTTQQQSRFSWPLSSPSWRSTATTSRRQHESQRSSVYSEERNIVIQLPKDGTTAYNANGRLVPSTCAICLSSYKKGEQISWSDSPECSHAYHTCCIVHYAQTCHKKQQQVEEQSDTGNTTSKNHAVTVPCPLCRNSFLHVCPVIGGSKCSSTTVARTSMTTTTTRNSAPNPVF